MHICERLEFVLTAWEEYVLPADGLLHERLHTDELLWRCHGLLSPRLTAIEAQNWQSSLNAESFSENYI